MGNRIEQEEINEPIAGVTKGPYGEKIVEFPITVQRIPGDFQFRPFRPWPNRQANSRFARLGLARRGRVP